MSRSFCVSPLPRSVGRHSRPRAFLQLGGLAGVASTVVFAAGLATPVPAVAAVDWSACLHAADPGARAAACTEIIGSTSDRNYRLRALNARGNALCAAAERCREAVPDFASVVKLAPDVAGYHDNLARALRAATRYPEALQESDRAISLAPKLAFVYVGKARTLAAAGRGDEALAVVQIAMALVPADAGLLEYEGKLLGDLKRYPESYAAFERALQMQPTRVSVYVRRADVETAEGQTAAAISDLEKYPPNGTSSEEVRGKLAMLRASQVSGDASAAAASGAPGAQKVVTEAQPDTGSARTVRAVAPLSPAVPAAAPPETSSPTCNLYTWTPLQRCIEDYHNENDPLPGGARNPRQWNDELAAHGRVLAEQHPEISWNKTAWNKLAEAATSTEKQETQLPDHFRTSFLPRDRQQIASDDAATSPSGNEVKKCNDAQVLKTMLGDVDQFKSAYRAREAASTPTAKGKVMSQIIDKWQVSVHNIRQQSYDATNNVRYCAADYQFNFQLPFDLLLVSTGLPGMKGICADAMTYKIEKTLDDPASFYVTHHCH